MTLIPSRLLIEKILDTPTRKVISMPACIFGYHCKRRGNKLTASSAPSRTSTVVLAFEIGFGYTPYGVENWDLLSSS
jgi:hypothetical protein